MEPASLENLHVLYQSTHFIVVNKHWDIRIDSKMWFCHQLDFSTSGALCVALNKAAAGRAYRCFKDRLVTKAYLALLRGSVEKLKTTLDFAIGKNTSQGKTHMMCIEGTEGCENPKPCQTELTVLEYGLYDGDPVTKVLLQPLTGRTHQLRVHCSAIGHPIVGDFTYSLRTDGAPYRMMLHAYLLRIPLEDEPICVTAPDPFLPSVDPKWVSQCLLQPLEGALDGLLGCGLAPGSQGLESQSTGEEEETNSKVSMETEEQRAQCQQWLCEWALH
ncbi:RNA pseudouridylate synthase domain-containing protein 1 isoform X2 [Scleropages formosus]|uniref:RNA pseudouridylate synthase domain-containing protein 1 isoform X2 n=1 Tax=Scleropages formosus TaxID=113540 RepID=UPI0010FAACAA|nr:RNA pseudouridylate synthase domain-containing protein 1 isoform X2 [Scleropages formosus]